MVPGNSSSVRVQGGRPVEIDTRNLMGIEIRPMHALKSFRMNLPLIAITDF